MTDPEDRAVDTLARLEPWLHGLSEERIRQLIDFARFLAAEDERQGWQDWGRTQLARAYGLEEPDYTLSDIKSECNA
jgi:hypothetical protein